MKTLYLFAAQWCAARQSYFTCNDIRAAYVAAGHPPPHNNWWGLVMYRLMKEGIILRRDRIRSDRKSANGRSINEWVSAKTHETKSRNRQINGYSQINLFTQQ